MCNFVMKKLPQNTDSVVLNYVALAHSDYLASRHLLLHGFLEHGAMLASTAVEKYLKAVVGVHGMTRGEHLCGTLYKLVKQCQPLLYAGLDMDFVKFLEKTFKLRYASVSSPGLAIVINQYRTLMSLDAVVAQIDAGFKHKDGKTLIETPYRLDCKNSNPRLIVDNVVLDQNLLYAMQKKSNKVLELKIEKNLMTFSVSYETEGVGLEGSFLKIPELSIEKSSFTLTRG